MTAAELAAYGAITAADYVWQVATIDPDVVSGWAYAHATDVGNPLEFVHSFDAFYPHGEISQQALNSLMGHVGEMSVADLLMEQGHNVAIAATSNNAIWDLLVDGHAANVKTVAEVASIKAEAAAHPGVTYLVPEDAHGHAVGNIVRVDGFNHDSLQATTADGAHVAGGEALGHFIAWHLPIVTVAITANRKARAVRNGQKVSVALNQGIIEVTGKWAGLLAGLKLGAALGGAVGHPHVGAPVGGIGGAFAGSRGAEKVKRLPFNFKNEQLLERLAQYGHKFADSDTLAELRARVQRPIDLQRVAASKLDQAAKDLLMHENPEGAPGLMRVLIEEVATIGHQAAAKLSNDSRVVHQLLDEVAGQAEGALASLGLMMVNLPVLATEFGYSEKDLKRIDRARRSCARRRQLFDKCFERK